MTDLCVLGQLARPMHHVDHHVYHNRHCCTGTFVKKHPFRISYARETLIIKKRSIFSTLSSHSDAAEGQRDA